MERLVEVKFKDFYRLGENILNKEQLEQLQSICSKEIRATQLSKRHVDTDSISLYGDAETNHEDSKILLDMYSIQGRWNIIPLISLLSLPFKIEFSIINTLKEYPERNIENNLLQKLFNLEKKLDAFDESHQLNCKVGVHISDLGLLNVTEVTYVENACTDNIQDFLDDGWRILAVCPQPTRRPDYILGRNKNKEG